MMFKTVEPEEMLESLLEDEGPFLSIFLPYGISGLSDDRMRIDRKNTITDAKKKLVKSTEDRWMQLLAEVERKCDGIFHDENHQILPCTDVYIASGTQALKTTLANALRPHFSFAAFAEIEPLIYARWANEPYRIFQLDPDQPSILRGVGFRLHEMDFEIPMGLAESFGDSIEDFKFKSVIESADRNNRSGTDLTKNEYFGYFGFSSRQNSHRDTNINYWLGIVSELFRENVDRILESKQVPNFVLGDGDICRRFIELNPYLNITSDQVISTRIKDDKREVIQYALQAIVDKKLALAAIEFDSTRCHENVSELVELLNAQQIRKLFVQQDDWFAEESVNDGCYEFSNPRSSILADALKCRAQVAYTRNKIDNKHGLAGLSYKGSDYLWTSQKSN